MTSVEGSLVYLLKQDTPVNTIISGRIYPDHLPPTPTYPAMSYLKVSDQRRIIHNVSRFQFSCYAKTYASAQDLSDKVEQALDRYVGVPSGISVIKVSQINKLSTYEADTQTYGSLIDFKVVYKRLVV